MLDLSLKSRTAQLRLPECGPSAAEGLPRILVDVRHEASHNELPSLALLRLAADAALTWLSQSYWQQQADHVTLRKSQIIELLKVRIPCCPSPLLSASSYLHHPEVD